MSMANRVAAKAHGQVLHKPDQILDRLPNSGKRSANVGGGIT